MDQPLRIKICGMRNAYNIRDVAALSPDYMGFIFYEKSPRFTGIDFKPESSDKIKRVGVFVNETPEVMTTRLKQIGAELVQLHGDESPEVCDLLRNEGFQVIKVFSVDDHFDFKRTEHYESHCDYFLFDTKGKFHGGNAKVFDWSILRNYNQRKPFFLSGGLTPDNIASVSELRHMNLHALDLNSGVELSPGLKDIGKIRAAQTAALSIQQTMS